MDANPRRNVFQFTPYILITLLSAAMVLVLGISLLVVSVPREVSLHNYRLSRRFLAVAYLALVAVGLWEAFGEEGTVTSAEVLAFTLIAASLQALLFTFSVITLINMRYITARRMWSNLLPILLLAGVLLGVLFFAPEDLLPVFYATLVLYCFQLGYYIVLFEREYGRYRHRSDNFFAGEEYRRLTWIRQLFYLAFCVGLAAVGSLFLSESAYIAFTVAYTVFYIYFAIRFINYLTLFHRMAPAVDAADFRTENGDSSGGEQLGEALEGWIAARGFIAEELTLEGLAKEFSSNPVYLSRHINSRYGQNFRSWIGSLRIGESLRLIDGHPDMPLAEVAERVGISSTSTFYRQFSSVTGMTPAEYRNRPRGN